MTKISLFQNLRQNLTVLKSWFQGGHMTRTEAINLLRQELLKLSEPDHSICAVAARKGIFCKGFAQDSTRDLFKKYDWLVKTLNIRTRAELEKIADLWQLTRQQVHGQSCACDVQTTERDTCLGWDTFSDADLVHFILELTGKNVAISPIASEVNVGM